MQNQISYLKYKKGSLPESEKATQELISLPLSGFITKKEQDQVISAVNIYK